MKKSDWNRYQALLAQKPQYIHNQEASFRIIQDLKRVLAWQKEQLASGASQDAIRIGILSQDPFFTVVRDLVELSPSAQILGEVDHPPQPFGYLRVFNTDEFHHGQGVAVLPLWRDKVIVVNHFRHATRKDHLEIPRGFGTPGLPAAENARKELLEEIQGQVEELIDLGPFHANTGLEVSCTQLFLARLSNVGEPEAAEGIKEIILLDPEQIKNDIGNGRITDGFTIAAYTRAVIKKLL